MKAHFETEIARVRGIPGWLVDQAAELTLFLCAKQNEIAIDGPILEIGVFKGKYFSLLRGVTRCKLVGVQLCEPQYAAGLEETYRRTIAAAQGDFGDVEFLMADSSTLSTEGLRRATGSAVRLAHIDGSHDAPVVLHDLVMTAPLVMEGGLMIMDDAFNFSTPGVPEAIVRFFQNETRIRPFAYGYNKLFATTASHYEQYRQHTLEYLDRYAPAHTREATQRRIAENASINFTPTFCGAPIVFFL